MVLLHSKNLVGHLGYQYYLLFEIDYKKKFFEKTLINILN